MTARPPLATQPPAYTMATTETAQLSLNTAPLLVGEQTPTEVSTVLTDLSVGNGLVIEGLADPTTNALVITQTVPGSVLTANHIYELAFTFTAAEDLVWTQVVTITVPL